MLSKKGKLIVLEGSDGSGKTTQAKLLLNYLQKNHIPSAYVSFPRYEKSLWGKMVKRYLHGDFGNVADVDPYLASMLYAGDRLSARDEIRKWLDDEKIVVANRYIGSNLAHMGGKIKDKGLRMQFIKWLEKLEYGENGIPREDLVIYLAVPVDLSQKLMADRKLDIHEKDVDYLERVADVFEMLSEQKKNWAKVACTKGDKILAPAEILIKVLAVLKQKGIL